MCKVMDRWKLNNGMISYNGGIFVNSDCGGCDECRVKQLEFELKDREKLLTNMNKIIEQRDRMIKEMEDHYNKCDESYRKKIREQQEMMGNLNKMVQDRDEAISRVQFGLQENVEKIRELKRHIERLESANKSLNKMAHPCFIKCIDCPNGVTIKKGTGVIDGAWSHALHCDRCIKYKKILDEIKETVSEWHKYFYSKEQKLMDEIIKKECWCKKMVGMCGKCIYEEADKKLVIEVGKVYEDKKGNRYLIVYFTLEEQRFGGVDLSDINKDGCGYEFDSSGETINIKFIEKSLIKLSYNQSREIILEE
jgi:hypothetical protein